MASQSHGIKATMSAIFSAFGETVIEGCGMATSAMRTGRRTVELVENEVILLGKEQELEHEESLEVLEQRKLERRAKLANSKSPSK